MKIGDRVRVLPNKKIGVVTRIDGDFIYLDNVNRPYVEDQLVTITYAQCLTIEELRLELEELKKEVVGRQETEDSLTLWVNELTDVVNAYKNARCEISDILVDVDKFHYTAEKGVQMIREALYKLDTAILELDCKNSRRKLKNENYSTSE